MKNIPIALALPAGTGTLGTVSLAHVLDGQFLELGICPRVLFMSMKIIIRKDRNIWDLRVCVQESNSTKIINHLIFLNVTFFWTTTPRFRLSSRAVASILSTLAKRVVVEKSNFHSFRIHIFILID